MTPASRAPSPQDIARIAGSQLFDADWYAARYPDVALSGLDPAEHYARFGGFLRRDPGPVFPAGFFTDTDRLARTGRANPLIRHLSGEAPDPARVLWAAGLESLTGGTGRAIALARRYLPKDHAPAIHLLRANHAMGQGDEAAWLGFVNAYLRAGGVAPLTLAAGTGTPFARLGTGDLDPVTQGPVVSVIMPAWNAEATIGHAMRSILAQTWRPLQLIVVDDASTDATWARIRQVAATDDRVVCLRNSRNAGPYVSKNIALGHATGGYITGHDADDWAHPERIEGQVRGLLATHRPAAVTGMLRMSDGGVFTRFSPLNDHSADGACVSAFISLLCDRAFFQTRLGHWDELRFGADSELIRRLEVVTGAAIPRLHRVGMICLDNPEGLTNDPVFGHRAGGRLSPDRQAYRANFTAWHGTLTPENAYLEFPQTERRFDAPPGALNPDGVVAAVVAAHRDAPRRAGSAATEDVPGIPDGRPSTVTAEQ